MNIDKIKELVLNNKLDIEGVHDNQYESAENIIKEFINNNRYVILKAKTQSGKTGVIMGVINILNCYRTILCKLKIDKFIYVTGDNQDIKDQAEKDFIKSCLKFYFTDARAVFLKNSDLQKRQRKGLKDSFKNTLIFLDESHYATQKERNKVPSFFKNNGVNYLTANCEELNSNNTYILSVSATPDKEMGNDVIDIKPIVELHTDKKYKGFEEFDANGQIESIDENVFTDEMICYDFFMGKVLPHLEYIKETEKKKKFVIMRLKKRNQVDIEQLLNNYFEVLYVEQKGRKKVNHDEMKCKILEICEHNKSDKYLLILIKESYRMGCRIDNMYKAHAGCVIDFCKDENNVEVTVQGLVGRFSGYVNEENENEWYKIKFFISDIHYQMLKKYYTDYSKDKSVYTKTIKEKEWGKGDNIGVNPEGFNNYPTLKIDITDYFKSNIDDWVDFSLNECKMSALKKLNYKIFSFYEDLKKYSDYIYIGSRRGDTKINRAFFNHNMEDGGKAYLKMENLGKKCFKSLLYTSNERTYMELRESFFDVYDNVFNNITKIKKINTYYTDK